MFRLPSIAPKNSRRGFASAIAIAVAFAGSSLIGTAAMHSPAYAQKKQSYSKEFVKVYQPVAAILSEEGGDIAAARAQLPAVYATVENDDDRSAAGTLTLQIGNKLSDQALQRKGLEMMLGSGKVPPENIAQYQFILGNLAYAAKDYPVARTALNAAIAAGYTDSDARELISVSYFVADDTAGGVAYLTQLIAAGETVPQSWLLQGLQSAYDMDDLASSTQVSSLLVSAYPTTENWKKSLQVVNSLGEYDGQSLLDLLRLMRMTDSLSERREFVSYIEAADPRIMSNEVLQVLAEGLAAGEFEVGEEYYRDVKRVADARASADRRDAPSLVKEARGSSTGSAAHNAGEVLLSIGSYAEAEEMYALALEKGVEDGNRTLTRLGIAQVHESKFAEAAITFAKVTGDRSPIATMWQTYLDTLN